MTAPATASTFGFGDVEPEQDRPSVVFGDDRPTATLEPMHRRVGVHADDQAVAESPGIGQQAHVPGVQQVEAGAGRHDRAAHGTHGGDLRGGITGAGAGGVGVGRAVRSAGWVRRHRRPLPGDVVAALERLAATGP
jgi:hypothetical protein